MAPQDLAHLMAPEDEDIESEDVPEFVSTFCTAYSAVSRQLSYLSRFTGSPDTCSWWPKWRTQALIDLRGHLRSDIAELGAELKIGKAPAGAMERDCWRSDALA